MFSKKNKVIPLGIPGTPQANDMLGSQMTSPTTPGSNTYIGSKRLSDVQVTNPFLTNALKIFNNTPAITIQQDKDQSIKEGKGKRVSYIYFYNEKEEKEKIPRLKCKIRSLSCWKLLCSHCRGVNIDIFKIHEDQTETPFLRIIRPCSFSICGYFRPKTEVYLVENNLETLVGFFNEPSYCFDIVLSVHTNKGNQEFLVDGNCCQRNLWCPGGLNNSTIFYVATPKFEVLSKFIKIVKDSSDKYTTDKVNASIAFPLESTDYEIALLTCAAVILDFKYFDN